MYLCVWGGACWFPSSVAPASEVINVALLVHGAGLCGLSSSDNGCEGVMKHRTDAPQASISLVLFRFTETCWGVGGGGGGSDRFATHENPSAPPSALTGGPADDGRVAAATRESSPLLLSRQPPPPTPSPSPNTKTSANI